MLYARQSTAIIVTVGPVLDADGVAVTDGVVGDFVISKNGGAPAALNGSATLTHRNTGHYSLSLTATDVNTVGTVEVIINDTVNACPIKEIQVVEPATYDVLFADAAPGPASPTNITAGTVTTATNVTTVNGLAANVITAAATAADFGTEVGTAVWASATRVLTANTNLNDPTAAAIADAVWDEAQADHVGAGTFGEVATEVAAILVDTAEIGAAGAGLTAINLPDQMMNITGNITGNLSGSVGSVTGAVGSVTGAVGSVTGLTASDVGAIKAKTDELTFTVAGQVDANVQSINDAALTGDGGVTPWGPA